MTKKTTPADDVKTLIIRYLNTADAAARRKAAIFADINTRFYPERRIEYAVIPRDRFLREYVDDSVTRYFTPDIDDAIRTARYYLHNHNAFDAVKIAEYFPDTDEYGSEIATYTRALF